MTHDTRRTRADVLSTIRAHHALAAVSGLHHSMEASFDGDDTAGRYHHTNGQGQDVSVRWDAHGMVAVVFDKDSSRNEAAHGTPGEAYRPLQHLIGMPAELAPLAAAAAAALGDLVTAGFWAGSDGRVLTEKTTHGHDFGWFGLLDPPESLLQEIENFSIDAEQAEIALRLARDAARGRRVVTPDEAATLLTPPEDSSGDPPGTAPSHLVVRELGRAGIHWPDERTPYACTPERRALLRTLRAIHFRSVLANYFQGGSPRAEHIPFASFDGDDRAGAFHYGFQETSIAVRWSEARVDGADQLVELAGGAGSFGLDARQRELAEQLAEAVARGSGSDPVSLSDAHAALLVEPDASGAIPSREAARDLQWALRREGIEWTFTDGAFPLPVSAAAPAHTDDVAETLDVADRAAPTDAAPRNALVPALEETDEWPAVLVHDDQVIVARLLKLTDPASFAERMAALFAHPAARSLRGLILAHDEGEAMVGLDEAVAALEAAPTTLDALFIGQMTAARPPHLSPKAALTSPQIWTVLPRLRKLVLGAQCPGPIVAPHLEHLELRGRTADPQLLEALVGADLPALTTLSLELVSPALFDWLPKLRVPALRDFRLSGIGRPLVPKLLGKLFQWEGFRRLRTLELDDPSSNDGNFDGRFLRAFDDLWKHLDEVRLVPVHYGAFSALEGVPPFRILPPGRREREGDPLLTLCG